MKKKILIAFLILALGACIYGCGKGNETVTQTPETTGTSTPIPTDTSTPTPTDTSTPTPVPSHLPFPTATPVPEGTDLSKVDLSVLPKIDGATANAPFYQAIAASYVGLDESYGSQITACSTTSGAYTALINGEADMIVVSYPSEDILNQAAEAGVEFEYHTVLHGAFVFLVNSANPVNSLTQAQLQGIYRGDITNWKEVGGNDAQIIAYQREENSGSQNGLYRYLLPKDEVMQAPTEYYVELMSGLVSSVAADYDNGYNSIGYSYYYYVATMDYNASIKLLAVDGITPNNDTIADGTYPFVNPTVVVVRKGTPADSPVYKIIDYMTSETGSEIAERLGYVTAKQQ